MNWRRIDKSSDDFCLFGTVYLKEKNKIIDLLSLVFPLTDRKKQNDFLISLSLENKQTNKLTKQTKQTKQTNIALSQSLCLSLPLEELKENKRLQSVSFSFPAPLISLFQLSTFNFQLSAFSPPLASLVLAKNRQEERC